MYDGSRFPLKENIRLTLKARKLADRFGASLEGEVGTVPYDDLGQKKAFPTDALSAAEFVSETQVDALAVSVGNIHRLNTPCARIDFTLLDEIEQAVKVPLVIHGTSGIVKEDISRLLGTRVAKFNIGTRLRQAFAQALRGYLAENPEEFDRLRIMESAMPAVKSAAHEMLRDSGW